MRYKCPNEATSPSVLSVYHHCMQWWKETVHALVVMHDSKQQKQPRKAVREPMRLAEERAHLEGYTPEYEDGKRRAVN